MNVAMPIWWLMTIAAFQVSIEAGLAAVVGQIGQWLFKSNSKVPNDVAVAIIMVLGLVAYGGVHMPDFANWHWEEWYAWFKAAFPWVLTAAGISSAAGHTGGAPETKKFEG